MNYGVLFYLSAGPARTSPEEGPMFRITPTIRGGFCTTCGDTEEWLRIADPTEMMA